MNNPWISRKELSKFIGINQSAIQKHLDKLKQAGILERIGPAKGGYWKVKEWWLWISYWATGKIVKKSSVKSSVKGGWKVVWKVGWKWAKTEVLILSPVGN